jgi:DNA-binding NarL/FixJ family response regulator
MSESKIKILIADDHPIFRRGLREIIETDARLKIVAEAEDGDAALALLPESAAQIAVLDIDMPGQDGFAVARRIREANLPVEIVILSLHRDERFLNAALDLGIKGYVLKDGAVNEIVSCIKAVAAGETYISPALSGFLIKRAARGSGSAPAAELDRLTPTERRVLKLIAEYKTSKGIAEELFVSVRTVEHHRANIALKLNLKGSHALIKFAAEHKSRLA